MMEEQFCEVLIRKKSLPGGRGLVFGFGILCVAVWISGIFLLPLLLPAAALTALLWWIWRRNNTEYEYSYVGGEIRIDRIVARSRRKHLITLEKEGILKVAPENMFRGPENGLIVADYSSGEEGKQVYALLYEKKGRRMKVLFEPGEKMLSMMKSALPGKITIS